MKSPQKFTAKITSVYDGDTCKFKIKLPFDLTINSTMRLYAVNTPEVRGVQKIQGKKVRDYVRKLILNKEFQILVYKKGKYGRFICDILLPRMRFMEKKK